MLKKFFLTFITFFIACCLPNFVHAEWIEASKVPAFYDNSSVDHTYACIDRDCYAIGNSRTYGGTSVVQENVSHRQAIFSECYAWHSNINMVYGRNGVCHQHTNRILYQTGETLPNSVRGYSRSRWLYGITGDYGPVEGRFYTCRQQCGQ